jgi:hypothetical protein
MALVLNHHERQLMQRLRGCNWVKGSHLPTQVISKLLQKGWIERRGTAQDLEYRITDVGMSEDGAHPREAGRHRPASTDR